MIKEIYLSTGLYGNKILTLNDNENLQIKLIGKTYPNLTYYLKAKNGVILHEIKFVDNLCEIKRNQLIYGKFKAKIIIMANENVVKEIEVEDLILKDLGTEFKVIPEVEILKAEINDMATKINDLKILCENTKNLVLKLNGLSEKVVK